MADIIAELEFTDSINSFEVSGDNAIFNRSNDGSINTSRKLLFSSQRDKKLEEQTIIELFILSVKHVFWLFLTSSPSIIFASLVGFGYSQLPWTNSPNYNATKNATIQKFYNPGIMLVFDGVIRSVSNIICLL